MFHQLWAVRAPGKNAVVIVTAKDREGAKRRAYTSQLGDRDKYTVEPISRPGDHIMVDIGFNLTF